MPGFFVLSIDSKKYKDKIPRSHYSVILNIPQTYPANPLNGVLVSGFVALDLKKAIYPYVAYQYLDSINYEIDVNAQKAKDKKDVFIKELYDVFKKRKTAIHHFFEKEEWDLFILAIYYC